MVCDLIALKGNRPDLISALPATDLLLSISIACSDLGRLCTLVQTSAQQAQCVVFVLQLRTLPLGSHPQAAGPVDYLDGRVGHVAVLPASARSAAGCDLNVTRVQADLRIRRLRQNRDRYGRRVDAPAAFRWRNALPPVATALELEGSASTGSADAENNGAGSLLEKREAKETSARTS